MLSLIDALSATNFQDVVFSIATAIVTIGSMMVTWHRVYAWASARVSWAPGLPADLGAWLGFIAGLAVVAVR